MKAKRTVESVIELLRERKRYATHQKKNEQHSCQPLLSHPHILPPSQGSRRLQQDLVSQCNFHMFFYPFQAPSFGNHALFLSPGPSPSRLSSVFSHIFTFYSLENGLNVPRDKLSIPRPFADRQGVPELFPKSSAFPSQNFQGFQ